VSRLFVFLALSIFSYTAHAHQDRVLSVLPNGWILGLPLSFGIVSLKLSDLETSSPKIEFRSGKNSTKLPECLTDLINANRKKDVLVSGSWYHDEANIPYYVAAHFLDPGSEYAVAGGAWVDVIFNLRTTEIISVSRVTYDGDWWKSVDVSLPDGCLHSGQQPNPSFERTR
jgi:hypothetical protein